jgi:very-short-patch-repair endonuclease
MLNQEKFLKQLQPVAEREKLESPIELSLIESLEKYLAPKTNIIPQYEVQTICGKYRLDFVITCDDKNIGLECDGKDFHDEWRDEWRDGLILQTGKVDTIYRFRGKDIHCFLQDCIYIIYHHDNFLFNDRYPILSQKLVSTEISKKYIEGNPGKLERNMVLYDRRTENGNLLSRLQLVVERRSVEKPGHWKLLMQYAIDNPGMTLDQLMELRKRNNKC